MDYSGFEVGETSSLIGESLGKCARDEQVSCTVPSLAPPPQAVPQGSKEGCPAWGTTYGPTPLQLISCAKTRKYGPNESQTSVLSDEEIANLSDGEFKALVIKMLTDLIELGRKMKEQMKGTQNEIKQIFRELTETGRKPGLKAMIWNKRKKLTSIQNKIKKQASKKVKRILQTSGTT